MKKRMIIPATMATLASTISGMPLQVLAYTDAMTGVEFSTGVAFSLLNESYDALTGVTVDIYDVNTLQRDENGNYDISGLTPVKSYVTQDEDTMLGLDSGRYVARLTPPAGYVLNRYNGAEKNGANEVYFEVADDVTNLNLGFIPETTAAESLLSLTIAHGDQGIPDAVVNVTYEAFDGTTKELGDFITDENGKISFAALDDDMPAGSQYYCKVTSIPAGYEFEEGNMAVLQAIEYENSACLYLISADANMDYTLMLINSITNENISDLSIVLTSETGEVYEYTSDENGYVYASLPRGKYTLAPKDNQYLEFDLTEIEITGSGSAFIYVTDNTPKGTVTFYVRDTNAQNVSGISYDLYDANDNLLYENMPVVNGRGMVYDLPYGDYKAVMKDIPAEYKSDNGIKTVNFSVDALSVDIPVILTMNADLYGDCSIELEITDADTSAKLYGETVSVLNENNEILKTVTMDDDGFAIFENLPEGTYHFELSADSAYYVVAGQTVTVNSSNKVAWQEVQAKKLTTTLVLNTQCSESALVQNLTISLYKNGNIYGTYLLKDGAISISDLTVGDYEVVVNNAPLGYRLTSDGTFSVKTTDRVINKTLVFEAVTAALNVFVEDTDDSSMIPGIVVSVWNESGELVEAQTTDGSGMVTFDLPLASYTVTADVPEGYTAIVPQNVRLSDADEVVDITLKTEYQVASMNIMVMDDEDYAVENAMLEILNSHGKVIATKTFTDGEYYFNVSDLPLGTYTLRVSGYDMDAYMSTEDIVVELSEEKAYDAKIVISKVSDTRVTGDVNITLKDEDGKNVELSGDVLIAISDENGNMIYCDYAAANGTLYFAELEAGTYTASVLYADDPWAVTGKSDVVFTVASGEVTQAEMILYKSIGSAVFNVTDSETSLGVAGVTIELFLNGESVGQYTTDENGQIQIDKLAVGTYVYSIIDVPAGYESAAQNTFTVTVDETTDIDIVLAAQTGQAVINIVDENGELLYETVSIILTNADGVEYEFTTSNGSISTGWIKTGKYSVSVKNAIEGYTLKSVEDVEVIADDTQVYEVVFARDKGNATVKVAVQNMGDAGLSNVKVELRNDAGVLLNTYTTDADGNISLVDLEVGKYSVSIADVPNGYSALSGSSFEITKDCNENVVLYATRDMGVVNIQVLTGAGNAVGNTKVNLLDADGNVVAQAITNDNGAANFGNVPTGEYTAKVDVDADKHDISGDFSYVVEKDAELNGIIYVNRHTGWLSAKCNIAVADVAFDIYDGETLIASGVTDANGEAVVENIPTGTYTVKYTNQPSQYEDLAETTITINNNEETRLDIVLTEKTSKLTVNFVYGLTGYPTAGVKFDITTLTGVVVGSYKTDVTGKVEMNLPEGYYFVKTTSVPAAYELPAALAIQIEEGVDAEHTIRLALATHFGEFALLVQDDAGSLADVAVKLYTTNGSLYKTLTTDARGQVYDAEIVSGHYYAVLSKAGYADKTLENIEIAEGMMFFETVVMEKAIVKTGDLVVTVHDDATGDVLAGATVCLRNENGDVVNALTSDENGVVTFEDVEYGNYKISAEADGYVESARISTIIAAETQSASINLKACTTGSFIATIHNDSNKKLANITVVLDSKDGLYHYEVKSNSQGIAELPVIESGEYNVSVKLDGYEEYNSTITIDANKENTADIELIEFKLGNIAFTIVDENDAPLSNVKITLSDGTILYTNEEGLVSVSDKDVGEYTAEIVLDGYESKTVSFNVEKDTTTRITVGLKKIVTTGNLVFNVSDEVGNALSDVSVVIDGKEFKTDEYGFLSITDLEAGTYEVTISKNGYNTIVRNITVVAKTTITANVTLKKTVTTGTINVVVTDKDGNALADAKVELSNGETMTTDATGMLTFEDVEVGSYTVTVSKEGYKNSVATIDVEAGKTYTVTAKLEEVEKTGNLDIIVKDEAGNLIEGASVIVNGQTVLTGANGVASFPDLAEGTYSVEITKDGFEKFTASVTVVAGATKQAHAVLKETITTGKLIVSVTDNDGNALANAEVIIGSQTYKTDESGVVAIDEIEAGTYNVTVNMDGYVSVTRTVTVQAKQEVRLPIMLNEIDTTGDLVVTVKDEEGNVLENATIEIDGKSVKTDASGVANVNDLPEGTYDIVISKDGYSTKSGTITITAGVINRAEVTLIKEANCGNVHVIVKDVDGVLASGATIKLYDSDKKLLGEYETDDNGELTVSDLDVGEYEIYVEYMVDEDTGFGVTRTFNIEKDKTTEIEIQFEDSIVPETTGDAYITVKDLNDVVLENVEVKLSNGTLLSGKTAADGVVIFEDLAPGVYTITAVLDGYHEYTGSILIEAGEIAEATINLKPITTGSLTVTVTDNDGNVLAGAAVEVDGKTYTSDENGLVKIETIEAGSYDVKVSMNGYVTKVVNADVAAMMENTCTVALEKEIHTGTGKVVITNFDGEAIENAEVKLGDVTLHTDENGVALFENLEAGTYDVTVSKTGYKTQSAQIIITAKETTTLELSLFEADGSIHFSVKDEDGNALANATITVNGESYTTDSDGKVAVTGLAPNGYSWTVSKDGYYESTGFVDVKADMVTDVSVVMQEIVTTGSLCVTVLDENGDVLSGATVKVGGNSAVTDESGKATFTELQEGNYDVIVSKDGYVAKTVLTTITAKETMSLSVVLEKEITVSSLNVNVFAPDNSALTGATVKVDGQSYTTDENGNVFIEELEAGEYEVIVTKDGYVAQSKMVVVKAKEEAVLNIFMEEEAKTGMIAFNVLEFDEPVAGASVTINGETYVTDEDGKIDFIELPAGLYDVVISKDGYNTVNTKVMLQSGEQIEVVLNIDKIRGNVKFCVESYMGGAIEDAWIYVRGNGEEFDLYTNADGEVDLTRLPVGKYEYTILKDGYISADGTFEVIVDGSEQIILVRMMPEQATAMVEFLVTDKQGNVLSDAEVDVDGIKGKTDAEGRIMLNVPIDTDTLGKEYSFTVKKDGYYEMEGTFYIGDYAITRVPVVLEKIPDYSAFYFTVKDETGRLLEGATIQISNGTEVKTLTSDGNGFAELTELMYGEYTIVVSKEGYKDVTMTETLNTTEGKHLVVEMKLDVPPVEVGTVTVTVVDQNGNLLKDAEVVIIDKHGKFNKTVFTGATGEVTLDVNAGEYYISAYKNGYIADSETIRVELNKTSNVTLTLEALTVEEKAYVEVNVRNQERESVVNARVVITDANGQIVYDDVLNNTSNLYLEDLAEGNYTIKVTKNGHKSVETAFAAVKGETTIVNIVLEEIVEEVKAGAFEILVTNENGTPLGMVLVTILNEDGSLYGSYSTFSNGKIHLSSVPEGNYSMYASYAGVDSNSVYAEIVGDQITTVKIVVDGSNPGKPHKPHKPGTGGNNSGDNVQTGDNSNIFLYGLLAVVSAIGAIFTRKNKKDKKEN